MQTADRAELLDHFGWLSFEAWGRLTPKQVKNFLRHARDSETGQIRRPEEKDSGPRSVEEHVAAYLLAVKAANRRRPGAFPPDAVEAKVEEIKAHWARKTAQS